VIRGTTRVGLKCAPDALRKLIDSGEEMTTRKQNGGSNLEAAMALLIQNQAMFLGEVAQIRKDFDEIMRILIRHEQLLANLPEAIRQKTGFKQ
jgi:hypothetical protein